MKFIHCEPIYDPRSEGRFIHGYAVLTCWDGETVHRSDLSVEAAHRYVPVLAKRHGIIDTAGIFVGSLCRQ